MQYVSSTSHIHPTISTSLSGSSVGSSTSLSAYLGQNFDEAPSSIDNNNENQDTADNYVQSLSPEERNENLKVMRQIFNHDLADLQRRRDYAGWVEARRDLRERQAKDPWFELNTKLKEAIQMGEIEECDRLKILIQKVGGPPADVKQTGEYAKVTEIYDKAMSLSRAESIAKVERIKKNAEVWKRMMAERIQNEKEEEEDYWNNPLKEEREALARRERTMKKIYGSLEEKRKKSEEKAKEIQGKIKSQIDNGEYMTPIEKAMAETKKILDQRKLEESQKGVALPAEISSSSDSEDSSPTSSASQVTYSESGRPRLPGDKDVTIGEIDESIISESSDTTTEIVRVEVVSSYSESKSNAEQRRHCFLYNIKITNLSPSDSIQLMSRKFEIQTVGSSRKDLVEGKGVTGLRPVLKPGEIFEYTSTAPLSVRPLGTTIAAARMSGSYSYKIVDPNISEDELMEASLGQFHFVFPPSQRVLPFKSFEDEEEDDDEDEEDGFDETNANQI